MDLNFLAKIYFFCACVSRDFRPTEGGNDGGKKIIGVKELDDFSNVPLIYYFNETTSKYMILNRTGRGGLINLRHQKFLMPQILNPLSSKFINPSLYGLKSYILSCFIKNNKLTAHCKSSILSLQLFFSSVVSLGWTKSRETHAQKK